MTPQTLSGWIKSGEIPPRHMIKFNMEILSKDNSKDIIEDYLDHSDSSATLSFKFSKSKTTQLIK